MPVSISHTSVVAACGVATCARGCSQQCIPQLRHHSNTARPFPQVRAHVVQLYVSWVVHLLVNPALQHMHMHTHTHSAAARSPPYIARAPTTPPYTCAHHHLQSYNTTRALATARAFYIFPTMSYGQFSNPPLSPACQQQPCPPLPLAPAGEREGVGPHSCRCPHHQTPPSFQQQSHAAAESPQRQLPSLAQESPLRGARSSHPHLTQSIPE